MCFTSLYSYPELLVVPSSGRASMDWYHPVFRLSDGNYATCFPIRFMVITILTFPSLAWRSSPVLFSTMNSWFTFAHASRRVIFQNSGWISLYPFLSGLCRFSQQKRVASCGWKSAWYTCFGCVRNRHRVDCIAKGVFSWVQWFQFR